MSDNEIHFSRLKLMAQSPAHYHAGLDTVEETPAMRFGSAVHVLVLGGDVIRYDGERKGRAWSAFKGLLAGREHHVFDGDHRGKAWQGAKEVADGRLIVSSDDLDRAMDAIARQTVRRREGKYPLTVVTTAEYDRAAECADSVLANEVVRDSGVLEGIPELPLRWRYLRRDCAGQLDVVGRNFITDVKLVHTADPDRFTWHAQRMHWPAQLDWYRNGARDNGHNIRECYILAIESRPPWVCTPFRLTKDFLVQGARTIRSWMEQLVGCEDSGVWPGYAQSVVDLDPPVTDQLDWGDAA